MVSGTYGPLIRAAREAAGYSPAALADRLGVDRTIVSRMEGGKKRPTLDQVNALVAALPLSAEELLRSMGVHLNSPAASKLPKGLVDRLLPLGPDKWQSLIDLLPPPANGAEPQ